MTRQASADARAHERWAALSLWARTARLVVLLPVIIVTLALAVAVAPLHLLVTVLSGVIDWGLGGEFVWPGWRFALLGTDW